MPQLGRNNFACRSPPRILRRRTAQPRVTGWIMGEQLRATGLKRVSGTKQHFQPASLIGGFGRPPASGRLREAQVAVRRKVTGAVDAGLPKAEALAWRPEMYRLASPPAGGDRDVVDKLWDPVGRRADGRPS
jgi:hypothetical protein